MRGLLICMYRNPPGPGTGIGRPRSSSPHTENTTSYTNVCDTLIGVTSLIISSSTRHHSPRQCGRATCGIPRHVDSCRHDTWTLIVASRLRASPYRRMRQSWMPHMHRLSPVLDQLERSCRAGIGSRIIPGRGDGMCLGDRQMSSEDGDSRVEGQER